MGSDLNRFNNKPVPTVTLLLEEVCEINKAIETLKALIKEECQDLELYKIVIEQDLKYL